MFQRKGFLKVVSVLVAAVFFFSGIIGPDILMLQSAYAGSLNLSPVNQFIPLSNTYSFPILKGLKFDPANPLEMKFIIDTADKREVSKEEASTLIRYFLAALTIPEEEIWVNLSPYEEDKIIPPALAQTDLGKDLLSQDYLLKQLTSSLTYPESDTGKDYWDKTYAEVMKIAKTTKLPVNTFNKIWIVPEHAQVYENGNTAFIAEARLKAMLEEDYLALKNKQDSSDFKQEAKKYKMDQDLVAEVNQAASNVMKEVVLPKINEDVNSGKNFATLRQVYHSLILGIWFKKKFKDSIYQQYINQQKVNGIDLEDKTVKEKVYQHYVQAFKKGLYDYIKTEPQPQSSKRIKRRYYSGGVAFRIDSRFPVGEGPNHFMDVSRLDEILSPVNSVEKFNKVMRDLGGNNPVVVTARAGRAGTRQGEKSLSAPATSSPLNEKRLVEEYQRITDEIKKKLEELVKEVDAGRFLPGQQVPELQQLVYQIEEYSVVTEKDLKQLLESLEKIKQKIVNFLSQLFSRYNSLSWWKKLASNEESSAYNYALFSLNPSLGKLNVLIKTIEEAAQQSGSPIAQNIGITKYWQDYFRDEKLSSGDRADLTKKAANFSGKVGAEVAVALTSVFKLRGAYQRVLDIQEETIINAEKLEKTKRVIAELFATTQHETFKETLDNLTKRLPGDGFLQKDLEDIIKKPIKDVSDGMAKRLFEDVANENNVILQIRSTEGIGRDALALSEAFQANEAVVPEKIKNEVKEIKEAIDAGQNYYRSRNGELYPILNAIIDVIEGTNAFVTNLGGRTLAEIGDSESGATVALVFVPRALGNVPDGYAGQFVTNLGEHAEDFKKLNVTIQGEMYSLRDPKLYAKDPGQIIHYLEYLAAIREQDLSELEEEIVLMDRDREEDFVNAREEIKQAWNIKGLQITKIIDGTVDQGKKAAMTKEMFEAAFGRPYGKHKTFISVGGAPELFMVHALAAGIPGAVSGVRILSGQMNKDEKGKVMKDKSQGYNFRVIPDKKIDEPAEMRALRPGDAEDILVGRKVFLEEDLPGALGIFAFITHSGVFGVEGVKEDPVKGISIVNQLTINTKKDQKPMVVLETREVPLLTASLALGTSAQSAAFNGYDIFNALEETNAVFPDFNIRFPLGVRGIIKAAKKKDAILAFQQAMSEIPEGYKPENARWFADMIRKIAAKEDFSNYLIKADHITVKPTDVKALLADTGAQVIIADLLEGILGDILEKGLVLDEAEKRFKEKLEDEVFMRNPQVADVMKAINNTLELTKVWVDTGASIFALDASFIPMRLNILATAFLAQFIPPDRVIEAEVGEIGGENNSTIADVLELLTGIRYKEEITLTEKKEMKEGKEVKKNVITFSQLVKDDKGQPIVERITGRGLFGYGVIPRNIALNNGTFHGLRAGVEKGINLEHTGAIYNALQEYLEHLNEHIGYLKREKGIELKFKLGDGKVRINKTQHGLTGILTEKLKGLRRAGIISGHVGTNWQKIVWDTLLKETENYAEVKILVIDMINELIKRYNIAIDELIKKDPQAATVAKKIDIFSLEGKTLEQVINEKEQEKEGAGKAVRSLINDHNLLKNITGKFRDRLLGLPEGVKEKIDNATELSAEKYFEGFGSVGSAKEVKEYVAAASSAISSALSGQAANAELGKQIEQDLEALLKQYGTGIEGQRRRDEKKRRQEEKIRKEEEERRKKQEDDELSKRWPSPSSSARFEGNTGGIALDGISRDINPAPSSSPINLSPAIFTNGLRVEVISMKEMGPNDLNQFVLSPAEEEEKLVALGSPSV